MSNATPIRRALLSVSDKTDLAPFAKALARHGVQLISTGGTAKQLAEAGLDVTPVDDITKFPEMMDGRVKTLHPAVHGGLLAIRDNDAHVAAMREHDIQPIDLVCVNLYPFEKTVAKGDVAEDEAIEQIDIGGPSMIRSASKNHRFVTVVTDPDQYDRVIHELDENNGSTTLATRRDLAVAAFARTAAYDTAIAEWMGARGGGKFPASLLLRMERSPVQLRYGENPHQEGAVYIDPRHTEASVIDARQLHGKALSFCNLYDANGALELVKEINAEDAAAVAVIKHANPCGFAVDADLAVAFDKAYAGDPVAAFGGIVACNRTLDEATVRRIVEVKSFLDVILAPGFEPAALKILQDRWKNTRLLEVGQLPAPNRRDATELDIKRVTGGLLLQQRDLLPIDPAAWTHEAGPAPTPQMLNDMQTALVAVRHVKSNAVCLVRDNMLIGVGAGQMDRLASCRIAVEKAGDRVQGSVAASDAFFPFGDGPKILIDAGVKGIVEPGGSKRDSETIDACNESGITLMFNGHRHFRH